MPHPNSTFRNRFLLSTAAALAVCLAARIARAENWPNWRGPRGDGTSSEKGLAVAWNAATGVAWKTNLPQWGTSTPAVWGDAIFLTAQEGDSLLALRLNKRSGDIEWTRTISNAKAERGTPKRGKQVFHNLQNLASPSPVTDGRYVVVHFGNGELAALDLAGTILWQRNLQTDYGPYTIWWGHANSPALVGNLVISVCMHDSLSDLQTRPVESYLVAHDVRTGKPKWRTLRTTRAQGEQSDAYTTPLVAEVGGQTQVIVMGANQVDGYDPATGKQLWFLPGLVGGRTVTGPTVADSLLYVTQGMRGPLLAIKLGGSGQRPTSDVVWRSDQGTPDSCCPVVANDLVFTVTDDGIARALDVRTGHLRWKQRLVGDFKASPLAADGRVYFLNTSGVCTVVAASDRFQKLAENRLNDTTIASPCVSDGKLLIRGQKALVCIGPREQEGGP